MASRYVSISLDLLELINRFLGVPTSQAASVDEQSELKIKNGLQQLRDALARECEVIYSTETGTLVLLPLPDRFRSIGLQSANLYTAEQMRDYALGNASRIAALHTSIIRRQLEHVRRVKEDAFEALTAISEIEDKLNGGDWDEIEEARGIANAALSACETYAEVLPANPLLC
ncbi:hypothetical protein [Pseudomonas serbica]|uniref:hypothetical protein n=1 Tax=Pseudomonas serbica TaxID=2965074 RepID=UPI00237B18C2|nr:hypothetical protein [Pseudomonas serbica]